MRDVVTYASPSGWPEKVRSGFARFMTHFEEIRIEEDSPEDRRLREAMGADFPSLRRIVFVFEDDLDSAGNILFYAPIEEINITSEFASHYFRKRPECTCGAHLRGSWGLKETGLEDLKDLTILEFLGNKFLVSRQRVDLALIDAGLHRHFQDSVLNPEWELSQRAEGAPQRPPTNIIVMDWTFSVVHPGPIGPPLVGPVEIVRRSTCPAGDEVIFYRLVNQPSKQHVKEYRRQGILFFKSLNTGSATIEIRNTQLLISRDILKVLVEGGFTGLKKDPDWGYRVYEY